MTKHIKTLKFGGTSLADSSQWEKVGNIIANDSTTSFVTVSAPGARWKGDIKMTDLLTKIVHKSTKGQSWSSLWKTISDRFESLISDLNLSDTLYGLLVDVETVIASGGAYSDFVLSRGEYLSAKIMTEYLKSLGLNAKFLDAKDCIVFKNGALDYEATLEKIGKIRIMADIIVVPGFYGADEGGRIFTFSRGGSDLTGALLACGSRSSVYENWTDAEGVCVADPKRINNPPTINELTYIEAHILNLTGASVLHKDTIPYLKQYGIVLHVRNTNNPLGKGTRIYPELPKEKLTRGLALLPNTTVFRISKLVAHEEVGFGEKFMHIFASRGIPYALEIPGIDVSALVVENKYLNNRVTRRIERAIHQDINPDKLEVSRDVSVIATIGATPESQNRITSALLDGAIPIKMNSFSFDQNMIVVDDVNADRAFEIVYNSMFSPEIPNPHTDTDSGWSNRM